MKTQEEFNKFDAEHPEFWIEFSYRANVMLSKGFKHYSARTIFEVARWHSDLDSRGGLLCNRYKINNNWIPFYARKWNEAAGINFFELRSKHEKLTETK